MKIEVRGDYSPMEEDFFQQNDFLCEMALQNQFNYCLKIRKLKLRVTIQNLNQFFMKRWILKYQAVICAQTKDKNVILEM